MDISFIFIVLWVLSGIFSVIAAAGILTYVMRTWQLIRAEGEGSVQSQLLDSMEQVQTQLYSMSERLERLEGRLPPGEPGKGPALPPSDVAGSGEGE